MLSKLNRLKKKRDFEAVFKKGRSFKNNLLIIKLTANKLKESRFGFIVSQKISKKAVVRNKVRRRLSESVGKNLKLIKGGLDVVLISLAGIEKKEFFEVKEAVDNIFGKAKMI